MAPMPTSNEKGSSPSIFQPDSEQLDRQCSLQGAAGIANLLFGKASFAGRLPVTWPFNNYTAMIGMGDMDMVKWPGRGYRHLAVPVLYPFGHGLSYTRMRYSHLRAVAAISAATIARPKHENSEDGHGLLVQVSLRNEGACCPPGCACNLCVLIRLFAHLSTAIRAHAPKIAILLH